MPARRFGGKAEVAKAESAMRRRQDRRRCPLDEDELRRRAPLDEDEREDDGAGGRGIGGGDEDQDGGGISSSSSDSSRSSDEADQSRPLVSKTVITMFEFNQNDPKVDSGSRLVRRGVARSMRPAATFRGVVLSTSTDVLVSAADRTILEASGIAGINCSWNRIKEIPWDKLQRQGHHRTLPFLVAANAINYGRPWKLNTAEAIAAALFIAGMKEDAAVVLGQFGWGGEFFRLNEECLQLYASASSSSEVRARQQDYLAKCEAEAVARRSIGVDLPPSSSEDESNDGETGNNAYINDARDSQIVGTTAAASSSDKPRGSPSPQRQDCSDPAVLTRPSPCARPAGPEGAPTVASQTPTPCVRGAAERAGSLCETAAESATAPSQEAPASTSRAPTQPSQPSQPPPQDLQEAPTPMVPSEPPEPQPPPPTPQPREQKAALLAIQAVSPGSFLQDVHLSGVSGNALAKFKRADFELVWGRFCQEVWPHLPSAQAAQIPGASGSDAAATGAASAKKPGGPSGGRGAQKRK